LAGAVDGCIVCRSREGGIVIHVLVDTRGLLAEGGVVHAFLPESTPAEVATTKTTPTAATPGEQRVRGDKQSADQNEGEDFHQA
jgi:hypothetical protein